jgi:hypothetical protein
MMQTMPPLVTRDEEVVIPDGEVVIPDGEVVILDGEVVIPDGEVVILDGEVVMPDSIRHPVFADPGLRIKSAMTCMDLPKNKP